MTFTEHWDPDLNKPYRQIGTPTLMARRNVAKSRAREDHASALQVIQIDNELLERATSGNPQVLDDIHTFLNR